MDPELLKDIPQGTFRIIHCMGDGPLDYSACCVGNYSERREAIRIASDHNRGRREAQSSSTYFVFDDKGACIH